jgi:hypothetical protein
MSGNETSPNVKLALTITGPYEVIKLALSLAEFFTGILFHYFPPNLFIRFVSRDFFGPPPPKKL